MIVLETYSENDFFRWNEFVKKSKNGLFLFDRNYMDYHKSRFVDASLLFSYKNKIIAVLPANAAGTKIYCHQGLTFGSLLLSEKITSTQVLTVFSMLLRHYAALGFETLVYKKIPSLFEKHPAGEDLYALFRFHAKLYRRDISSVIALENRLLFSETKRQNVKKCELSGCTLQQEDDFTAFWDLLHTSLLKFGVQPVHRLEEIAYLQSQFPEKIKLFTVRLQNELLAGTVVYDFGDAVHTQYMAASPAGKKIGALDFLIHQLITGPFTGKKHFSFGISTESEGRVLNEGLLQQKEMLGGRAIVLDHYEIALNPPRAHD